MTLGEAETGRSSAPPRADGHCSHNAVPHQYIKVAYSILPWYNSHDPYPIGNLKRLETLLQIETE
jgi:hypothetical protein